MANFAIGLAVGVGIAGLFAYAYWADFVRGRG